MANQMILTLDPEKALHLVQEKMKSATPKDREALQVMLEIQVWLWIKRHLETKKVESGKKP